MSLAIKGQRIIDQVEAKNRLSLSQGIGEEEIWQLTWC